MPLLSDQDRQIVSGRLAAITHPVKLLFFTQTIGAPETVALAKQIVDEVAGLNEHISVEEVNLILDRDRAAAYGVEDVPGIAMLRGEEDTGIRFLGAPSGYEFMSFIEALVLTGTENSGLSAESRALIAAHVKEPLNMLVFTTPT